MNKRVNTIWVPDGDYHHKKICEFCHVRYESMKIDGRVKYCCPQCGAGATGETLMKEQSQGLKPAHMSEPMIGKRRKKGEDENDMPLPPGGVWISDEVIEPQ